MKFFIKIGMAVGLVFGELLNAFDFFLSGFDYGMSLDDIQIEFEDDFGSEDTI